jgi:hypothetical protein
MTIHDEMSDNEVIRAASESLSGIPVASPPGVEAILARGRARRRRRIPVVTGALAVAAGAAVGLTALLPSSPQTDHPAGAVHPAGIVHPAGAVLAAWTVTKLADGKISVTIRELKDPAGLQSTLRADGVPASVTFASQQNPACRPYPGGTPGGQPPQGTPLLRRVFPKPYQGPPGNHRAALTRPAKSIVGRGQSNRLGFSPNFALIVIDPSALPGHADVQIATVYEGPRGALIVGLPTVVYASRRCTGT